MCTCAAPERITRSLHTSVQLISESLVSHWTRNSPALQCSACASVSTPSSAHQGSIRRTAVDSMQASMLRSSSSSCYSSSNRAPTAATPSAAAAAILHARLCNCSSKRPASTDGPVVDKDFEVPAVGWMWDPSSAQSHTTARSLKKAKIKAKK